VEAAGVAHGASIAGSGSLLIPLPRLGLVLGHALAVGVEDAKVAHSDSIAGSGGLLIPLPRFGRVRRRSHTTPAPWDSPAPRPGRWRRGRRGCAWRQNCRRWRPSHTTPAPWHGPAPRPGRWRRGRRG